MQGFRIKTQVDKLDLFNRPQLIDPCSRSVHPKDVRYLLLEEGSRTSDLIRCGQVQASRSSERRSGLGRKSAKREHAVDKLMHSETASGLSPQEAAKARDGSRQVCAAGHGVHRGAIILYTGPKPVPQLFSPRTARLWDNNATDFLDKCNGNLPVGLHDLSLVAAQRGPW